MIKYIIYNTFKNLIFTKFKIINSNIKLLITHHTLRLKFKN